MGSQKHRDLGSWTGLQHAFAAVAGSCSAARAQCLKHVRDSHTLDDIGLTCHEFCTGYAWPQPRPRKITSSTTVKGQVSRDSAPIPAVLHP